MNTPREGKELRTAGFDFAQQFNLLLKEKDELKVTAILRTIPGRRMVVAGTWQNKPVVAKLFYDKRNADRHIAAEETGIKQLHEHNIPSPKLYSRTQSQDGCVSLLIFAKLQPDVDLMHAWQHHSIRDKLMPLFKQLIIEIATQHVFGLVQRDLHLNNFLVANNIIYTLDGAQIESHQKILPKKESMQNLALLFSQLGINTDYYQKQLFQHYVKARGWIWKQSDLNELYFMVDLWGGERWKKYERKIFRTSTHFQHNQTWYSDSVCEREFYKPELKEFFQQPDAVFKRADAVMLKNGRSSTVIRICLDGHDLVIKRYNMKNVWHWLRRCFRTTRAKKCWRISQKLRLFGINTAQPVAYLEKRFLGLSSKSYYVTKYIAGVDIKEYLQSQNSQSKIINRIQVLLAGLKKIALTHGDLKATNLIVNKDEDVVLIDLDGAHEHRLSVTLEYTSQKEWQRFMRNFAEPITEELCKN